MKSDIIVVGSNPSQASMSSLPFHHTTKSWKTLADWLDEAGIGLVRFDNVSNIRTPGNRPLKADEIKAGMQRLVIILEPYRKICAVGKTASKALTQYGIDHLELPHPSGLNRKLNDPEFVKKTIAELKAYYEG